MKLSGKEQKAHAVIIAHSGKRQVFGTYLSATGNYITSILIFISNSS